MYVRRTLLATLFLFISVEGGLTLAHAQQSTPPIERPEIRVGDRWKAERKDPRTKLVLLTEERVVTAVDGPRIKVMFNGTPGTMTSDLTVTDKPGFGYDSGYQFLRFPLEVGKKWNFKTNWSNKAAGSQGDTEMDVSVMSLERLRVAAGEFDTIKLEATGYMNITGYGSRRVQATYWYAPSAKAIIRMDWVDRRDDFVYELTELSLAK
jgi:hypothetical protein